MNNFIPAGFFVVLIVMTTLSSCKNNLAGLDGFNKQPTGDMLIDRKYDEPEGNDVHFVISENKRTGLEKRLTIPGLKMQQQWIVCKSQFMRVRPERILLQELKEMEKPMARRRPVIKSHVLAAKFDND